MYSCRKQNADTSFYVSVGPSCELRSLRSQPPHPDLHVSFLGAFRAGQPHFETSEEIRTAQRVNSIQAIPRCSPIVARFQCRKVCAGCPLLRYISAASKHVGQAKPVSCSSTYHNQNSPLSERSQIHIWHVAGNCSGYMSRAKLARDCL
jgi:hypothetical protein